MDNIRFSLSPTVYSSQRDLGSNKNSQYQKLNCHHSHNSTKNKRAAVYGVIKSEADDYKSRFQHISEAVNFIKYAENA